MSILYSITISTYKISIAFRRAPQMLENIYSTVVAITVSTKIEFRINSIYFI